MSATYRGILTELLRIPEVTLAMLVGRDDGMIIDFAGDPARRDAVAAFAAALYSRAGRASIAAGIGDVVAVRAEASDGHVCVAGLGQVALVVLAGPGINLGKLRIAMRESLDGTG